MKENSIEELKQRLEGLYKTQQARLDVGADDLDIREEIAEVEEEIKELQDDTKEETIKTIEKMIKSYKEADKCGLSNNDFKNEINALEHILSDYKRVLKENEILKEEKEQAWEEWNNLEQGSYETEQKLKQQIKKLQKKNEELKEYIAIAPNLDEMTATKYRNIQQGAYMQGRAEEQQKAEQIIYENYIPKQKAKDKIEEKIKEAEKDLQKAIELEKETKTKEDSILWWTAQIRLDERIKVLKELLKEEK